MSRAALGPADLTDVELLELVGTHLGEPPATLRLLSSAVEEVPYDLDAITTRSRHWVHGEVASPTGPRPFRFFVKQVQAWSHSPLFASVPAEVRPMAAAGVPWRTEPLVYGSDLADRLPAGLSMPRAARIDFLPDEAAAIWLPDVSRPSRPWGPERVRRAAYLLGRLAASPRVAPLATVGEFAWQPADYVFGRVEHQVKPMLLDDGVWRHPLIAASFDAALRDRVLAALHDAPVLAAELAAYPVLTAHGDACPNNLLPGPGDDDVVLIDFQFWNALPVAFDLGQLLVGDVQIGRGRADTLVETEAAIVPAYVEGLRAEGCDLPLAAVRRAHALQLALFSGISAVPFDLLPRWNDDTAPALLELARKRAAVARFSMDLLDATRRADVGATSG